MKKAKLSCAKLAKLLIARVLVCAAIKRYCVDKQLESLARNRERTGHVYPQQKSGLLDFRRELSAGTARRELSAGTARRELLAGTVRC